MVDTTGSTVAVAMHHAERRLVRRLREQSATGPDRAIVLEPSRLGGRAALRRLVKSGAIREAGGRVWLDETAYQAMRERRRLVVVAVLLAVVVLGAIMLIGVMASGR